MKPNGEQILAQDLSQQQQVSHRTVCQAQAYSPTTGLATASWEQS